MNKLRKNKKQTTIIIIIFSIISLIFLSTIAYSAFSSTMNITGIAHARVEADVRITDFRLASANNATSLYEEFGKNHINSNINLISSSSTITYYLEITNYGKTDVGIYNITGLPTGINYHIKDYNLKDKICDTSGKCNSFIKRIYELTISTNNASYSGDVKLEFEFKSFHKITYIDFKYSYPTDVFDGDSITIDLSPDAFKFIEVESSNSIDYTYNNKILTLNNVTTNIIVKAIQEVYSYNYTGSNQTFNVPIDGTYKIELWGAAGGKDMVDAVMYDNTTGLGGYTSGNIYLTKGTNLYIYVGGKGEDPILNGIAAGGYNGGGTGSHDFSDDEASGGGGGATDIRLVSGVWNDDLSLKSRIMVAAGAAGEKHYYWDLINYISPYTAGGGLVGHTMFSTSSPGTQTTGYAFGVGQNGLVGSSDTADGGGNSGLHGGGGGYYGGTSADTEYIDGAAGGSSFISGHNGCVAITSSTSLTPRNDSNGNKCTDGTTNITCSYHYSNYKFNNTIMIDGAGFNWTTEKENYIGMPTFDGTSTMTGNSGDGYAKITLLKTNREHQIRYTDIDGTYPSFVEDGKTLTLSFGSNAPTNVTVLFDNIETNNYSYTNGTLTIPNVSNDIEIIGRYTYTYDFTGNYQTFIAPRTGTYKIELWGAAGGNHVINSELYENEKGLGGYTSGEILLSKNTSLYIYVGGKGGDGAVLKKSLGGYNGGGSGSDDSTDDEAAGGGGGATDVRLINGAWNDELSLKSRIMVAAGAAGELLWEGRLPSLANYVSPYCSGGGLRGYTIVSTSSPGTQTSGYAFGIGQDGTEGSSEHLDGGGNSGLGGGGAGYYGGTIANTDYLDIPAGGSSFISGHNGCVAIESSTSLTPRKNSLGSQCSDGTTDITCSYHYSGYKFTNTKMIDGAGYNWTTEKGTEVIGMPTFDGTRTMTGNIGNGYAKISLIN